MKQKLLSILVLLLMTATGAWADTTVTWTENDMSELYIEFESGTAENNTIKGITVTASDGSEGTWEDNYINKYYDSSTTITFTSSVGNIKSIAITAEDILIYSDLPAGWTLSDDHKKLSWSGDASTSVSLTLQAGEDLDEISEIVFTIGSSTPDPTYIVAGNNAEIFGSTWDGTYEANKMTKGDDGKYTKTYNVEDAFSDIQLKVVKDGQDWIGDETGFNVTFSMKQAGSFTVTLDPNANPVYVTVTGDNVVFADTEYAINYATGMQNGTVTGPDTAKEDDEVTLTITPAAGYVLESISVTGVTTENAVEVTDGKFTMPAEDVNVIATFKSVTYSITVKEGTEDAANWTVSPNPAEAGQTVTISYTGTKKVKSIKAVKKAAPAPARTLAEATAEDCGKVVCAAGHLHDAKTAVPTGCTAVGILGKVTETGHGLILALQDATSQRWNTINGWTSVTTYAGTTLKQLPDDALGSLTSYTTLGSTAVSNWCVAQKSDYEAIFINLGSTAGDYDGNTYDANVNAYITTGVGGTAISGVYWSATDRVTQPDFGWDFNSEYWNGDYRGNPYSLRPVLGF